MAKTQEQIVAEVKQSPEWKAVPVILRASLEEILSSKDFSPEQIKRTLDHTVVTHFIVKLATGAPDGTQIGFALSDEIKNVVYRYLAVLVTPQEKN